MKKHLALFVVLLAHCLMVSPQAFYSFSLGTSIPTGSFSDQNIEEGMYAKVGYYGEMEGGYSFTDHWGIGLQTSFHLHDVDQQSIKNDYQNQIPSNDPVTVKSGEYKNLTLLTGPLYKWYITPEWDLTFKGMIGGMVNFSDDIIINTPPLFPSEKEGQIIKTPENDFSFAYGGGIYISYLFPSKVGITFKLQMNGSRIIQSEFINGDKIHEDKLQMFFVNFGIGLEFL